MYLLAVETGLRVRELQSLTVGSFDFESCTVTLEKKFTKNRKGAVQFLKRARAVQLKSFFAGRDAADKPFNMPSNYRTGKMIHADLKDADIPIVDDADRKVDFHGLRHTLATELDRSGATLKERADIMRHSLRGNLTLGTYTHLQRYDIRQAIENLTYYPWPEGEKGIGVTDAA